jgi:hypothetical protein
MVPSSSAFDPFLPSAAQFLAAQFLQRKLIIEPDLVGRNSML